MRIILLGPPGAGKGTQAQYISERYEIPHISTGDILRQAIVNKSVLGKKVATILSGGDFVLDDIIIKLVKNRIKKPDCHKGFLLDGCPRTVPQAQALILTKIHIDFVIEIEVSESEVVKRLLGRRVHLSSGRVYHIETNPPVRPGYDDQTGEPLVHREDDKEETIRKRLALYYAQTQPVVGFYQKLLANPLYKGPQIKKIAGNDTTLVVCDRIFQVLSMK